MRHLSFRAKVWLWFTASVLAFIFSIYAAGSLYVDHLQKRNVSAVVELAREQAHQLRRDLIELLVAQPAGSEMSSAAFRADARRVTSVAIRLNQNIEWAMIVDAEGNKIVQTTRDGDMVLQPMQSDKEAIELPLPDGGMGEVLVESRDGAPTEVREPLSKEGHKLGEIRFKLADSSTYRGIQETSHQISQALLAGALGFLAFVLLLFAVLWRLFARQIELTRQNADLDRMAYVGTLASGLAHEIRNPLSAMNVNLDVMQEDLEAIENDPQAVAHANKLAGRLQTEVRQLNSTLTSFLDFALPQRESFTFFSLRGLVDELLELHEPQFQQAGISVEVSGMDRSASAMEGDRRLIHQALRHLIVNAVQVLADSLPKQLRVRIEPGQQRGMIRVAITDSGPGIDPADLDKLFDAFFTRRKGGSGLGLAVTRKVVMEHGGSIHAENNSEVRGATFVIELPVKQTV